ncbi:hypothetical protein [Ottowia caeni]|uniref:hypothetical protein n=1 Tax=Ottowia caeni TaxID=2870339 RepID=UPI001E63CF70|nr:hypothetical protein [Ottowia caeni]
MKPDNWQSWPTLGHWEIPANHQVFAGHFPGLPVVPGALLLSWLIANLQDTRGLAVKEIREARFQGTALPGTALESRTLAGPVTTKFVILALNPIDSGSQTMRLIASGSVVLAGVDFQQ